MSYILDALRKADHERERERGAIPGIHAQPAPLAASEPGDELHRQPLVWAVASLSAVVLALLAWLFAGRPAGDAKEAAPVPSVASPTVLPGPAANPPQVVAPSYAPAPAPLMPRPVQPLVQPLAQPPVQQSMQQSVQQPVRMPARSPALQAVPPARPAPMPVPSAQPATRVAEPADGRVLSIDDLPDDIRRQLPNIAINGSKYSDTPASRLLIVNGQIFREGDQLAPGLTLEQIKLKEAVLRFRGYRYAMPF